VFAVKYCPKCKYEFEDWCEVCNDCGIPLTNEPPVQPEPFMPDEYEGEALLTTVSGSMEAEIIASLLGSYNIPVIKKYRGIGNYLSIYMGASNMGVDLYVPKSALETSKEILSAPPGNIEAEQAEERKSSKAEELKS
jgi:hypothetical protein